MPLTLTPAEVAATLPDAPAVTALHIASAKGAIHRDFGSDVDTFAARTDLTDDEVKGAWSVVAVRFALKLSGLDNKAVTNETERDYSYGESVTLAALYRFQEPTDGIVRTMLGVGQGTWQHI